MNEIPTNPVSLTSVETGTMMRFIRRAASAHNGSEICPSLSISGGMKVRSSCKVTEAAAAVVNEEARVEGNLLMTLV